MSQPPTPYSRQYNFAGWSVSNPTTPHQGNKLDQEYNALLASVNATISRLGEIQKDDGSIQMNEATAAALAAESDAVLASAAAAAVAAAAAGSHTHTIAQVTSLQTTLNSLQTTLDTKATTSALTSGLATKANTAHTHILADVPGLSAILSTKLEATNPAVAKAWISFDGTTTQPTVISSYNVSSVTRTSAGVYLLTFTTALTDGNYCWTASARGAAALPVFAFQNTSGNTQTPTQMSIVTADTSGPVNCPVVNLAVYR
jgi:hypothetical protein